MKKLTLILLVVLLWQATAKGQPDNPGLEISRNQFQAKQVIPASPEAASLGKYGNIPVSLFTGTPNVSIPLVELKGNFLSLPVTLSYNHSGFKPDEIAPWTGLGWDLVAGGVITRTAIGDPDGGGNYYKTPSPLAPVPTDEYQKQLYYESVRKRETDIQPDAYYFNFMGHSGKFVVKPDGTIVKKEKSYLKIVWSAGIESDIIITDEQGIQYEFRALEQTRFTPFDDQPGAPPMVMHEFISAWYLSKVIAPNGLEELEFEYYSPTQSQATMSGALSNTSVTFTRSEYEPTVFNWQSNPMTSVIYTFQPYSIAIYKKFLKKVTLRKNSVTIGYVDFESDLNTRVDLGDADFDGERRLSKVKLYNTANSVNTLVREFDMTYDYFGMAQTELFGYRRLMLRGVQEISTNPSVTPSPPSHTFHYNGETASMPKRFVTGIDHWGFYNGQTNVFGSTPTLIPTVNVSGSPYASGNMGLGANREPSASDARLTLLERIDYPTGGYTTFDYEGNSGSLFGPSGVFIGGLRIKEMIDHSFPSKPAVVKRYEYKNEDGSTSGQIAYYPQYYTSFTWEDLSFCGGPPGSSKVIRTYNATISANSIFGLGSIQGSHIGYSRVTEYQIDLTTNQALGKKIYTYNVPGSNEVDEHIGNGELLKEQTFDNGGKLLEEQTSTYIYEDFIAEQVVSRKLEAPTAQSNQTMLTRKIDGANTYYLYWSPAFCVSAPAGYSAFYPVPSRSSSTESYILPQRKKLDQHVRKVFDNVSNTYLTYTRKFTYGNADHTYPTLIEEVDSKSDKVFTAIKYVADYTISCSPSAQTGSMAAALSDMKTKNMMGETVEKLQYRENAGGSNRRYINGSFTQYKSGLPEKIYYLQAAPMPTSVTASQASCIAGTQSIDNNYRLVATLTYDAFMNLQEESKTNDVAITYLWGYDHRFPVAKIGAKTYSESMATGISQAVLDNPASESALRTELNKLRTLSGAIVSTHTYQPMVGMTSATDSRGQLLSYEYDALNRLINIKDNGEIIKNFRYNYGLGTAPTTSPQTLFYNAATQASFTRTNCGGTAIGEPVIYKVPYGKYAATNQLDADNMAATDIATNGQNYANSTGTCYWLNQAQTSSLLYKNDCLPSEGPPIPFTYTVPAGKYKSYVGQPDANGQAVAEIAALQQSWINSHGECSCVGEGKKYVNGNCESPSPTTIGGYFENGQWTCVYRYFFSDGTSSEDYYYYSSEPCPVAP